MFVDRDADLAEMESRWGLRPQFYLLWGRRRVGKSALVRRFAEGKDAVIYQAVTGTATDQLALLTRRINAWRADAFLEAAPLVSWAQAFAYFERLGRERKAAAEPLLLVLDEFQYLAASDTSIVSLLADLYETVKHEGLPLFIIISGSAIGFFEDEVLVGKLFGRRTGGGLLRPLGYRDAGSFFPDWSAADRTRAWAVLGGMPYYLEQFDPGRSLGWNVRERMLQRNQVLYNEAELLLRDQLQDPSSYQSVLAAIAGGATRNSEIAARSGIATTALSGYLRPLVDLHLVERAVPFGADPAKSKQGLWTIADGYLAFWHAFIRPNTVELEAGRADEIWRTVVRPELDRFVSRPAFEQLCRDYVRERIGRDARLPASGAVGAWWGSVKTRVDGKPRNVQCEADVVAGSRDEVTLVGEAKWSDDDVGLDALKQLRTAAAAVPGTNDQTRLALFSRTGFEDRLRAVAEQEDVLLFDIEELFDQGDQSAV
ncbi:MAG: ATP-binding protein [Chloroflexota bacterium]